jgi:hypothetical protein
MSLFSLGLGLIGLGAMRRRKDNQRCGAQARVARP